MGNAVTGCRVVVAWFVLSSMAILVAAEPKAGPVSLPDAGNDDPAKRLGITRADLAASYLRLEQAYFASPPAGQRAADINRGFDRATLAFFMGRSGQAIEQIDALTDSLHVPPNTAAEKAAASLKAVVEPPVWSIEKPGTTVVRVVSLYEAPFPMAEEVLLQLSAVAANGQTVWQAPLSVRCGPEAKVDATLPIEIPSAKLVAGLYRIELGSADGRQLVVGRFNVVTGPPLDEQRTAIAARLDKIAADTPQMIQALATCRARNALLTDQPSPANSAQFLADLNALAQQVGAETATLETGRDPYQRRAGDYWRVLVAGSAEVPLRVYASQGAVQEKPAPLLIVLHGAGGDENMFPEAYGAGVIKKIADEHGLLIASPSTYRFGSNPQRIAELVDALAYDYAIDRNRIYLLGHSMGAGAAAGLIRGSAKTVAAACCMAGGNNFQSPTGIPPLLVLLAELDAVVPVKSVQAAAERAQQAKMPVELKIVPNYGHTLLVGDQLGAAVEWLLKHQLPTEKAE